jgi:hypothetical protein
MYITGAIATFLFLFFNWGGICIDGLNVASPASIWGEWIACGPLLILITITIVEKQDLTRMDWFLMITFMVSLIAGFLIIIPKSYGVSVFWLVVSCVTYLPVCYLPWHTVKFQGTDPDGDKQRLRAYATSNAQRFNLSVLLVVIFPLYIVVYFAAFFAEIGYAETIVAYQVLSVLTKGICFKSLCYYLSVIYAFLVRPYGG